MKHHIDAPHFLRFSLVGSFVIAVLAIFGIVSLVAGGPPHLSTGAQLVQAQEENIAGSAIRIDASQIRYVKYNPSDRVLVFTTSSREIQVPVNAQGNGNLVLSGLTYIVVLRDATGQSIGVDVNADGSIDKAVKVGGTFQIKK